MELNWTECEKALPNKQGVYLVTLNSATVDFCMYFPDTKQFGWKGSICDEVVAWMSLPEPYQK